MLRLNGFPEYWTRFFQTIPYNRVVFLASKVLQSSELEELQSLIYRDVSSLQRAVAEGDGIFLTGGVSHVVGPNIELDRSTIYLEGMTIEIPKATIEIPEGVQQIGILSKYKVITYVDDEGLRDIAKGTANMGKPGAARIETTSIWAKAPTDLLANNESFYPVFTYDKGALVSIEDQNKGKIKEVDYTILNGLLVSFKEYLTSMSRTALNISEGRIRLNAEILTLQNNSTLYLEGLEETTQITNEVLIYDSKKIRHPLKNTGVASIDTLAVLKRQKDTIVRGNTQNSSDPLSKPNVNRIISVTQDTTEFTKGSDYYQLSNSISWNLAGAEPIAGSEYTVEYEYLDYDIAIFPNADAQSIDIPNNLGIIDRSKIYVSYKYFTPRKDSVYLNNNGQVGYVKGTPSISNTAAPEVPASLGVKLAEVFLRFGQDPAIENIETFNAADIEHNEMLFTIGELTAAEKIRNEVLEHPRGLWVDPLLNNEKRSNEHEQSAWTFSRTLQTSIQTVSLFPAIKKINESQYSAEALALAQTAVSRGVPIFNKTKQDLSQGLLSISPACQTYIPQSVEYLQGNVNSKSPIPFLWVAESKYLPKIEDLKAHPQRIHASVKVKASGYTPNESCDLYMGQEIIKTLVASPTGEIAETEIVIPSSYMNGGYSFRLVGRASGSSSKANALFTLDAIKGQKGIYSAFAGGTANSFHVQSDSMMSSCDIYLNHAGKKDIWIQVSIESGGPNSSKALAYGKLPAAEAKAEWNNIKLNKDLFLSRNATYAIILYSEDPECVAGSIRKGDNSATDTLRAECGMLWTSESGASWSRYSDEQLAFRINSRKLLEAEYELAVIDVSACTHILVSSQIALSKDSQLIFKLIDGSGERHQITPSVISRIPFYTGRIAISLVNKHTGNASSVYPEELQVLIGSYKSKAEYVSVDFPVLSNRFKAVLAEEISTIGDTEVFALNSANAWQPLSLERVGNIHSGTHVYTHYATENLVAAGGNTKLKIITGLDQSGEPIEIRTVSAYSAGG